MDDEIQDWLIALVLFAMAIALGISLYRDHERTVLMRQHGCQLIAKAPTGREVYCGKACFEPEYVYVYECIDGTRTEVHS